MTVSFTSFVPITIIVIVSVILFRWQENKHRFEVSLFFTFEQLKQKMIIPKRDMLDSVLFVFVGATLMEFGSLGLWSILRIYDHMGTFKEGTGKNIEQSIQHQFFFVPIVIGIGIALTLLGVRSIIVNMRYKRHLQNISS